MSLKKLILSAAAVGAMSLGFAATQAAAATVVHVGTLPPNDPYFYLTSGSPFTKSITADFGATINGGSTPFDDVFEFTIPQNGVGSGSLSTSFSSTSNELTISKVLINGTSYTLTDTPSGQDLTVGGIPIHLGASNTIEVIGATVAGASAATFTGTATFAAVPEPASWIMMIGGLGLAGAAMRRRRMATGIA